MQEIMDTMDIAFPHLNIYLRNVPKTFSIGGFSIAMYGVVIALSMLAGIVMAAHMAKKTGQDPDVYWDISLYIIISSIIGARIYYVIFFWDFYKDDPIQVFNLRGGGLAIYGGIIAAVMVVFLYCKKKKYSPFLLLDTAAYGLVLGQIIGRWANFFNREVFGDYTDSLLAMRLPLEMVRQRDISENIAAHIVEGTNYIQVHPTFLYESLWNVGVLLVMLLFLKHKKFDGEVFLVYLVGYGIGRAWIEYIRTDQLYIQGTKVPVSLVLSLVIIVFSVIIDVTQRRKRVKAEQI
ncbi:MAG: prolipoprotein diacylglyceryl transferase [Lachnospiraceae bacterium]|nr:prolipoprotein diacylglyceryl transferase [Lachnospiraceae bacterium]